MGKFYSVKNFKSCTFRMSGSILRKVVASSLLLGSLASVQAQIITSDVLSACPGDAIELSQTGFLATVIDLERKSGDEWVKVAQFNADSHYIIAMTDSDMTIRAKAGLEVSNELTIMINSGCAGTCMESSTGDYIIGTDFDIIDPSQNIPAVPAGVVSNFADFKVELTNRERNYYVTQDLTNVFGGQYPILDNGEMQNSYFVFSSNPSANSSFQYSYPCREFHDQNFRLTSRMYVMKRPNCTAPSAKIRLETRHGEQTLDRAVMKIYDNDNQLVRQDSVLRTYGSINLGINNKYEGQLLRVDFTFYGYFPGGRDYHPSMGDYNGLMNYTVSPLFQEFDGCYTVAIDYLSAEVENVSLMPQVVCAGKDKSTIAFVAGFDSEAEYKWEIKNEDGVWESVGMGAFDGKGDAYRKAEIPVTKPGYIYGRVIVKSQGFLANGQTERFERIKEFTAIGKECSVDTVYTSNPSDIMNEANTDALVNVYTVEGYVLKTNVKMSEALKGLKRGFYIVGDKKIYVSE